MARSRRRIGKSGACTHSFISSSIRGIEKVQTTYETAVTVVKAVKAIATAVGL